MSNFTNCPKCGSQVLRGADECPQCGAAMFERDRRHQAQPDFQENLRREQERIRMADYERRKFGLEPRGENESVDDYERRINRQKTPLIVAEHQRILARMNDNPTNDLKLPRAPAAERIPGDDDDIPEVDSEQAA